jgi:hypothetical protein
MVELDVEARQGDSGGPIFNDRGELAGVLFGAGEGTTLGSFGPRVQHFLAALAPDIGRDDASDRIASMSPLAPNLARHTESWRQPLANYPSSPWSPANDRIESMPTNPSDLAGQPTITRNGLANSVASHNDVNPIDYTENSALSWSDLRGTRWYDPLKSALALVGLVAVILRLVKTVR